MTRSILSTLFVLAAATGSLLAQVPNPTTPCGIKALECFIGQNATITNFTADKDFVKACEAYTIVLDCINSSCSGNNTNTTEVHEVAIYAADYVDGICESDGSVSSCGTDLTLCLEEASNIQKYHDANKTALECKSAKTFYKCAAYIRNRTECPKKYLSALDSAENKVDNVTLDECYGDCGTAIETCYNSPHVAIKDKAPASVHVNWIQYCSNMVALESCLDNVTITYCTGHDNYAMIQSMLKVQKAKLDRLCGSGAKPCLENLQVCTDDLNRTTSSSDVAEQCRGASKFLECVSELNCTNMVQDVIDIMRREFQTAEREEHCPTLGSCKDRLTRCARSKSELSKINPKTQKDQYCSVARSGILCLEFVRDDPICSGEKSQANQEIGSLKQKEDNACGGASFARISPLMALIALAMSLKHILQA